MTDIDKSPKSPASPPPQFERAPDFTTKYANNLYFESTAWDMKITFGHVEQATGAVVIRHDFAVTIPWPQAKLALFWLRLHVETAEDEVGTKIPIRKDLIPVELLQPDAQAENDPAMKRFREIYERLRREFIATL
jgi:hypothetical protein